jgi:hypothetical protein
MGKELLERKSVVNRVARPGNREEDMASVYRYTHTPALSANSQVELER